MTNRNSFIDILKLILAFIVISYHFEIGIGGGYLAVEAFFMISGYFMMQTATKTINKNLDDFNIGESTLNFIKHKFFPLLHYIIPSAILGFILYIWINPRTPLTLLYDFSLLFFEIVPLQNAGYSGFFSTGVMWYVSSLFISSLILYPLCLKFNKSFALSVCPILSIMLYGLLCHNLHCLDAPDTWLFNIVSSGLIRGLAGISAGCFMYEIIANNSNNDHSLSKAITVSILELSGYLLLFFIMLQLHHSPYDFLAVFLIFGLLYIGFTRSSLITGKISFKCSRILADYSLAIYLNHFYWRRMIETFLSHLDRKNQILIFFTLTLLTAAIIYLIANFTKQLIETSKINV